MSVHTTKYYHVIHKDTREINNVSKLHGGLLLGVLGADSTSLTYRWVWIGYPFGHNTVMFWPFSTSVAVIIYVCPKIVICSGTSVLATPP